MEATQHNIDIIGTLPGVIVEGDRKTTSEMDEEFFTAIGRYVKKGKDYPHQEKALAKIGSKRAFGLFMEQGTGKTRVMIQWAGMLYCADLITGVIVVSKKGVHRQWIESQLGEHLNCEWSGAFWPLKDEDQLPTSGLQWLAFNYDGLKSERGMAIALAFAKRHKGKLLILADESQEIKNPSSIRHKAMQRLKPFSSHRGLATGTPIAKDLTDEWAQLKWLDEDIIGVKYLTSFRAEFCIMGGYEGRSVVAHKNIEGFKRRVDPWTFRATKEEIGILPKQYSVWNFDLLPVQIRMLKEMKKEMVATLQSGDTVSSLTAAVAVSKLQQIAGGFIIDSDHIVHRLMPIEQNPRIEAAMEWLSTGEGKAVIWARFREDMRMIGMALSWAKVDFVEYHGGVSDKDRKAAIDSFMSQTGAQVFLANPQSAGTGLNLQGLCNRALYYSNSHNAIDRWQSEDRIHRIGTLGAVTYTDLVAHRSTDAGILQNLKRKKGISDMALGDILDLLPDY